MDFQDAMEMDLNLNENPEFSTQFVGSSLSNTQSESNFKKARGINFNVEEDLLIVSTWLNTSLDAVHGNEQKNKIFWQRVWEYFHKCKKSATERKQVSLMNRWSTAIQTATNKFCGCYAQIESRHQSGVNEHDKIANAKLLYQELNKDKPPFQFEHCWKVLRYQPKWLQDSQNKKSITKKNQKSHVLIPDFTPTAHLDATNEDVRDSNFIDLERPAGRKAEKEQKKRKHKDIESESSSCLSLIQIMREEKKQFNEKKIELFERQFAQEQERLAFDQEKLRLEQMKEDERIMMIDTTEMPEMLANWYKQRQMEILSKKL